ncbi:hypothetical protein [Nocardia sp. NPDC050710]|uniref:hypothetical protein n=1 Tax=Nocardia sp. NPDC050710 TaxID=3157220 RepID=UPI0033EE04C8
MDDEGRGDNRMVTVFTGEPEHEKLLMYTYSQGGSRYLSMDGIREWWRAAPLS